MRILRALSLTIVFLSSLTVAQTPNAPSEATAQERERYKLEAISTENPVYPQQAREMKIEGQVDAMLMVAVSGDVERVNVLKSDPLLAKAVEDAATKWKFKPVLKDDKPIRVMAKATFRFSVSDNTQATNGVPGEIGLATEPPTRVRVSSGVSQGLLLSKVNPTYPPKAREAGIQGVVVLQVLIGRDGTISDLQPVSGPAELVPAAMEAVRQWRYKPYLLMGEPVEIGTQIQVNFTLTYR